MPNPILKIKWLGLGTKCGHTNRADCLCNMVLAIFKKKIKKQIKIKNVLHRVGLRVLGYMGSGNRKLNNNKVYEMVFNCKVRLLKKEAK